MGRAFAALGCTVQGPGAAPPPPGSRLPTPDLSFVYYRWMRKDGPVGRPRAIWLVDEPYWFPRSRVWSRSFDWIFVNDRSTLRDHGWLHTHWLPAAYEPVEVADPIACDVAFVGAGFPNRRQLIGSLLDAIPRLDLRLTGPDWPLKWQPRSQWVSPEEAARYYAGAKVSLNIHRAPRSDSDGPTPTALNFRAFEIAAVGGVQITEDRPDRRVFLPSCPVYDGTAEHLLSQVRWLLEDDAARAQIAAACRNEVGPHTYQARARLVLESVGALPDTA